MEDWDKETGELMDPLPSANSSEHMVEEDTGKGEPTSQAQSITEEELGRKGRQ